MTVDAVRDLEVSRYSVAGFSHAELSSLVELAADTAGMPYAAINLMQADTQVSIATHGIDIEICARQDSMCNAVLYAGRAVQVRDASEDPRWAQNPYVNGERAGIRFYFAQQLTSPKGIVIGTLCVFDEHPRELREDQVRRLSHIATWIVDVLELRVRTYELEQSVRELTRTRAELERSNEQLGRFAGQVAHDLRGPVTAISASLSMLREHEGDTAESRTWLLERALGSTTRMDSLIGNMLSYASLGGSVEISDVDLNTVATRVRDDLAADLLGVHLTFQRLPVIRADATQVRILVQNLVANAAKFARGATHSRVRISGGTDRDGWWLEVADNGPGVPPASRELVFTPFAQLDTSSAGVGLGLATCRRIVESHGGTIALGDAPEGGALVRITIPFPARVSSRDGGLLLPAC